MPQFNAIGPDDLPLTPEPFDLIETAVAFIPQWCERYRAQGYYRDADRNIISLDKLPDYCVVIPVEPGDPEAFAQWIRHLIHDRGLNFHPDTPFTEYTNPNHTPFLQTCAARHYDEALETAFAALGDRIYDIAAPILREAVFP